MEIPERVKFFKIDKFWDDQYKDLEYINKEFSNPSDLKRWKELGFENKFTGDMCDMRSNQPSWNNKFIDIFQNLGLKNVTTTYYRMNPGTVLPIHSDLYERYIKVFNLKDKKEKIRRIIVFLEDWSSGHYGEYDGIPYVLWKSGDSVIWNYDTPHMAANYGNNPRYTLQITAIEE